jgi:hypothetical protein
VMGDCGVRGREGCGAGDAGIDQGEGLEGSDRIRCRRPAGNGKVKEVRREIAGL